MAVQGSQDEAVRRLDVAQTPAELGVYSELARDTTSRLCDKPQPAGS